VESPPAVRPERAPDEPARLPPEEEAQWQALLDGSDPSMQTLRRRWRRVPSGPRCKVCSAPFHGVGRILTRVVMHGQSTANPTMCQMCFGKLSDHPGGAEIDISIVFADIRGSTAIAEQIGAARFRDALQEFYRLAGRSIESHDGFVDKYLGDGVMALFVPVLTGDRHAERALGAAVELVAAVERSDLPGMGIRVGAGVHCGRAFLGVLGSGERLDFSALGDPVNVAARLGALAGPGEVVASRDAWSRAAGAAIAGDSRQVEIVGRHEPLEVVAIGPLGTTASAPSS
jgi:adenylate cyclase